jgi:hypothetical protein
MPDGTLHQWDASGPRGSAGRYLGSSDGGQPQAGQTQLPSPPAETQDQQLTRLAAYQFGTANRYLANGPRVPGPSDATLDANAAGLWDKAFAAVPLQLNPAAFGLGGPQ